LTAGSISWWPRPGLRWPGWIPTTWKARGRSGIPSKASRSGR